jgi:hypothetical protein
MVRVEAQQQQHAAGLLTRGRDLHIAAATLKHHRAKILNVSVQKGFQGTSSSSSTLPFRHSGDGSPSHGRQPEAANSPKLR